MTNYAALRRLQAKFGSPAKRRQTASRRRRSLAHAGHLRELAGQRRGGRVLDERDKP